MLEYRALDLDRNEIRLLTVLGLTTRYSEPDSQEELVECLLEHFSLDEYTPQYSRFLEVEAAGRLTSSLSVLWERITRGVGESIHKVILKQESGVAYDTLSSFATQSLYSNRQDYTDVMDSNEKSLSRPPNTIIWIARRLKRL